MQASDSVTLQQASDFVPHRNWRVELSQKKLQRIKVIENAVEGRITVAEAGEMLGLSEVR
jgi:hypothetical protein